MDYKLITSFYTKLSDTFLVVSNYPNGNWMIYHKMSKRILISYNRGETFLFGYSNDDGKTFVESVHYPAALE